MIEKLSNWAGRRGGKLDLTHVTFGDVRKREVENDLGEKQSFYMENLGRESK